MNASVSRRAVLGATATVGAVSLPSLAGVPAPSPAHPDAELFRLLDGLPVLKAVADAARSRQDALWMEYAEQDPMQPDALRVRRSDGFDVEWGDYRLPGGGYARFYEGSAPDELRNLPPAALAGGEWREDRWVTVPDERRVARHDEIVAAFDRWEAERDVVRERIGVTAADREVLDAVEALCDAEAVVLSTAPLTFAGLVAKARWAGDGKAPADVAAERKARIAFDVVAMAERLGVAA